MLTAHVEWRRPRPVLSSKGVVMMLGTFRAAARAGIACILLAGLLLGSARGVAEGSPVDGASPSSQDDALVILSTLDISSFQAAIAAVRNNGGEVPQAYPPNAFVAALNPEAESALSQLPAVARIERGVVDPASLMPLGGQAETAANIWNTVFRGVPDPIAAAAPAAAPPERSGPDFLIPPPEAPGARTAPAAPSSTQTSEFMAGTVAYTVVFVESSGGTGNCSPADAQTENWDAGRQNTVLSEISQGLAFWTGRSNRPSPLTFTLDNQGSQPTSCEPITRPSSDEGKWIADVLKALGRPDATPSNYWAEARAYADSRRTALGADWGYLIFVVDSLNDADGLFSDGSFAYAYLNGPFLVMTYDNDGWGIGLMNLVTAHETGHIFGALDEYASSGCSTSDSWGYLNASDASCNNGGTTTDFSIMGEASEQQNPSVDVSSSARDAIGWRNPGGSPLVVDVVRTATVSLTPYTPDPTSDNTPTYAASAGNTPWPPEGPRMLGGTNYGTASPVSSLQSGRRTVEPGQRRLHQRRRRPQRRRLRRGKRGIHLHAPIAGGQWNAHLRHALHQQLRPRVQHRHGQANHSRPHAHAHAHSDAHTHSHTHAQPNNHEHLYAHPHAHVDTLAHPGPGGRRHSGAPAPCRSLG